MVRIAGTEVPLENFVGGEFRAGAGPEFEMIDPATGESIASVASVSPDQLDDAVDAAAAAFPAWSGVSPAERSTALLAMAQAIEDNEAAFSSLESLNVGKPISGVPEEIGFAVDNLRFFAGGGPHARRPRRRGSTSPATPRCCGATPSGWSHRSPPGTTRS